MTIPVKTMSPRLPVLLILLATFAACDSTPPADDAPDAAAVTVHCGVLIDGIGDAPLADRTITVIDGRIDSVREGAPPGGATIDLSDRTCLPGLIDTHTHITEGAETADLSIYYERDLDETMAVSRRNSAATLGAGFTTVRNLGAYYGWAARELNERIERGEFAGPRIQYAGFYLTIPGGGGDLVIPGYPEARIPPHVRLGVSRGPDEFRAAAEAAVAGGAGVIKAIASGAVLAFGGVPGSPEMTRQELQAAAEVAHANGIRLTAHAHGAQSIKDAILAGADSIEHASLADDEAIRLAVEHDVAFSMDVYNGSYIATVGREEGWPEEFLRKNDETTEAQRQVFTRAHAAGVPITYGTDSGVYPHGDNARQFPVMVERGMTPMEAIKAATSVAARYIGWADDVGAIEPGRFGDIIAVRGDPLADIAVLQHVEVVIKGGERYK
jgi:imidazolonepropionase-like amidohydrolase